MRIRVTKPTSVIITWSAVLMLCTGMILPLTSTANATNSITKVQSGLVTSDSLTTGDTGNWTFAGTATSHDYYEDSQGLHIGIKAPQSGQWVNYYASYSASQPNAELFHAIVTIPDTMVPDGVSNIGLYVEGSDFIPHVGCEAYADSTGYYWVVEQSSDAGQTYTILYITQPSSTPQTQDCTIITNGSNYLKVYIGGNVVFSSTTMNLGMSTPFHTYVQDDTSSSSSMHYATYSDYYSTTSEDIKVTNNPSNAATIKITGSSGQVLSSASVTSGIATLNVGKYSFPLDGTINVYDANGNIIASSPASIYGGDIFSITNTASTPQSPTGLVATAVSSSQINLSWTAPGDDGGSPITGYKIERSTNGGTFSVLASNTASTGTSFSDTSLAASTTYTYRVSAINSVGSSSPSNTSSATTNPTTSTLTVNTQDSDRNTIIGYYTELYQNGNLVDSGYTPYTFTLNNGQTYTVDVVDYGKYEFDHWLDTGSVSANRVMSISSNTQITAVYKTVPQFPTGLTATVASSTQINLSWSAPTDNGGSPITGYTIERSSDSGTTWSTISSNTRSTATTFSDTSLVPNTTYTYRVSAINVVGTSSTSNTTSATTTIQLRSITLAQPGLVVSDSLINETMTK
ncbi:MAG: fibronectin type III domain-containing protein, partial [Candidatus Nitrosotalea sp.]|nr:fibronectin type III domain-containing protein [Candidatus Nitrosotalea sp.]